MERGHLAHFPYIHNLKKSVEIFNKKETHRSLCPVVFVYIKSSTIKIVILGTVAMSIVYARLKMHRIIQNCCLTDSESLVSSPA